MMEWGWWAQNLNVIDSQLLMPIGSIGLRGFKAGSIFALSYLEAIMQCQPESQL